MEHASYASRLRYLDADDLDDDVVDFDDLDVRAADGDKLGELDGFVVEHPGGRPVYLVVDSGGWFTSRRFLIPAEHATLDGGSLRLQISRSTLAGYPEFDEERFGRFTDDEYEAYHRRLGEAWGSHAAHAGSAVGAGLTHDASTSAQRQPGWWPSTAYREDRLRPIESGSFVRRTVVPPGTPGAPIADTFNREHVTARARDERRDEGRGDVSPHLDGRAQPGDVLGIETAGETTGIGDTIEDEDKRRSSAEKAAADDPPRPDDLRRGR